MVLVKGGLVNEFQTKQSSVHTERILRLLCAGQRIDKNSGNLLWPELVFDRGLDVRPDQELDFRCEAVSRGSIGSEVRRDRGLHQAR